jgi:hypothetical protein
LYWTGMSIYTVLSLGLTALAVMQLAEGFGSDRHSSR